MSRRKNRKRRKARKDRQRTEPKPDGVRDRPKHEFFGQLSMGGQEIRISAQEKEESEDG